MNQANIDLLILTAGRLLIVGLRGVLARVGFDSVARSARSPKGPALGAARFRRPHTRTLAPDAHLPQQNQNEPPPRLVHSPAPAGCPFLVPDQLPPDSVRTVRQEQGQQTQAAICSRNQPGQPVPPFVAVTVQGDAGQGGAHQAAGLLPSFCGEVWRQGSRQVRVPRLRVPDSRLRGEVGRGH